MWLKFLRLLVLLMVISINVMKYLHAVDATRYVTASQQVA